METYPKIHGRRKFPLKIFNLPLWESPSFLFVMACVRTRAPLVCFPYIIDTRLPFSLRPEGQRRGTTQHRLYFTWQIIPDIIFPCMKVILLPELEVQCLQILYGLLSRIKWQLHVELNQYLLSNIQKASIYILRVKESGNKQVTVKSFSLTFNAHYTYF